MPAEAEPCRWCWPRPRPGTRLLPVPTRSGHRNPGRTAVSPLRGNSRGHIGETAGVRVFVGLLTGQGRPKLAIIIALRATSRHLDRMYNRALASACTVVWPLMTSRDVLWKRTVQSLVGGLVLATLIFLGLSALPENFSRLVWLPIAGLAFAIPYSILVARIAFLECKFPLFRSGVFRIKLGSIKYRIN